MNKNKNKKSVTKAKKSASETRDISSYVCRIMVYGAVSGHGISRESIEKACIKYCDENPSVDITNLPVVMMTDDGTPVNRAIFTLLKKYCKKCTVFSTDGVHALVIGRAAKEIVSKLDFTNCTVRKLKTKTRVSCGFPINRKLKCFNGERVADHIHSK